jgi:hypothetical protein
LFLLLLIELGASFPAAVLGGLLVALDNALLLETKIIVWDGLLVASILASLVCFCVAERQRARTSRWLAAAGVFAGLAVGCKLTGLAALGTIAICLVAGFGIVRGPLRRRVGHAAIVFGTAFAVYAAGWIVHVELLNKPGPADAFYTSTGHVVEDVLTGHASMVRKNIGLTGAWIDGRALDVAPDESATVLLAGTERIAVPARESHRLVGINRSVHHGTHQRATAPAFRSTALARAHGVSGGVRSALGRQACAVYVSLPDAPDPVARLRAAGTV